MRRLATRDDEAAVFAIYMHARVIPFLSVDPMPREAFHAVYEELLASGGFFVFEVDGAVAGFYSATRYAARTRHVVCLGTLAVDPALHGSGVAYAMLHDALARLRADGIRRVELYVECDNARARRFYERLGFVVEGTLRAYYKRAGEEGYVDELVMGLLLG